MGLKRILSLFIALSFFLEHIGLNSFEIHFNSQIPIHQHIDIDADGNFEHTNESLGQDSVFKTKKVFCTYLESPRLFLNKKAKKPLIQFIGFKYDQIFNDDIFKPPISLIIMG